LAFARLNQQVEIAQAQEEYDSEESADPPQEPAEPIPQAAP